MFRLTAAALLLITTFFWGVTFTVVKAAVAQVDVFVFLSQRFLLAFGVLLAVSLPFFRRINRRTARRGAVMGIFLFGAYAFQTEALLYTSASNTGFLTGLNVVFVPILGGLLFRERIPSTIKGAVLLSLAGLFLLCTDGKFTLNGGDFLAGVCAVCVALHLLCTGRFAPGGDVLWLTTIQIGTVAALSTAAAFASGKKVFGYHPELTAALVVCALIATVFAFLVQTWMQRFLSPAQTALIFCTEPVFAALYAWWSAGERLGPIAFAGAVLIVCGMVLSELTPREEDEVEPGVKAADL
jgi:drug/metabolite transporter (DMT)-like permease